MTRPVLVAWALTRVLYLAATAAVPYPTTLAEQHGFFPLLPLLLRGRDVVWWLPGHTP